MNRPVPIIADDWRGRKKKELAENGGIIEMQSTEAVSNANCCQIVSIAEFGSRRSRQAEKQHRRIQTADDKFASLDEMSQRSILAYAIGYMESARNLISSGRPARANEVSRIFEVMEESINEAWNGGMV
ncbi:hypothetical protein [Candidatus Merdisoma sp. JLR.KK006]|uniref:hypothetical protein n=1 Tax=Candidatus Merdisoma sp. JLR.KK006 TaxID=3112626 RepID=UPI002FEFE2D2